MFASINGAFATRLIFYAMTAGNIISAGQLTVCHRRSPAWSTSTIDEGNKQGQTSGTTPLNLVARTGHFMGHMESRGSVLPTDVGAGNPT